MTLLADAIRFREPARDFVVDLVDALKAKGVEMILRRESFDAAEARIFQAPRQNNVAVHPVLANDERGKAHPDLESNPRLLRQDGDRTALLRDFQQLVEDDADIFRFTGKVRRECMPPTGMGLIAIGEETTAA